jgi:hypothetical protein
VKPDLNLEVFLAKDAMRTDWQLMSATESADPFPENDQDERLVSIRIKAASGAVAVGYVYLVADPNPPKGLPGWRIPVPYAQVALDTPKALGYLTLNGKTFKTPLTPTVYQFFPGSYVAQSLVPALVTTSDQPLIVATAGYSKASVASLPLGAALTPAAVHIIDQQVRTQLNVCARSTSPAPSRCPFRLEDPTTFSDGTKIGRFSGLHWKIGKFPALAAPMRGADGTFTVDTSTPGVITATGNGVGATNGDGYTITVPCSVSSSYVVDPTPPNTLTVALVQGVGPNSAPTC